MPEKVAVVRLDALGDTLLSTPAIDALCRELGEENVLVLVSSGLGSVFGAAPAAKEISSDQTAEDIARAIDEFGAQTVYTFSEKKRALRGAFLSGAKERIGFDPGWTQPLRSLEVKRFLTVRFPIVNSLDSSSRYHEVERYCRLVAKGLSKKSLNGGRLRFFSMERPEPDTRGVGSPGFQWAEKWLQDGWPQDLLLKLLQTMPVETKIFVSPAEKEQALSALPEERASNLVCRTKLTDYADELATCSYLVSIDTGAVHVASAMGVPVVDVFPQQGAHHTVPRWRPWMTPHRVVLKPAYQGEQTMNELLAKIETARNELMEILSGLAVC